MVQEQIQYLSLDQIFFEQNVRERFDDESLDGLMQSIAEVGQLFPIRVRKCDKLFAMLDGARRFGAMKKLGKSEIAAIVENKELSDGDIVQRQLVANIQRDDLSAMEKARAIHRLMQATGWNASEAASHLGMSNATVSRLLSLLALPDDIQEKIAAGEISASAAYQISRIEDGTEQSEVAEAVAKGRMTRDAVAGRRKGRQAKQNRRSAAPKRVTAMLAPGRSVTVTSSSLSLEGFIEVISEVLEKARRVRSSGVELGTFIAMLRDQATSSGKPEASR